MFKIVKQAYIHKFILHNEDIVNMLARMTGFKQEKQFLPFL